MAMQPEHALLSDINADLINTYQQVRRSAEQLTRELKKLPVTAETFHTMRLYRPRNDLRRAVRFLYLNRTAFSGLYRVNRRGEYNVPYGGGQRTPDPLWRRRLLAEASTALASARISEQDFVRTIGRARSGDFVYCDPTYTVAHNNNGFVRYNEQIFSWKDQMRLADACRRAVERGATVAVSNAHHADIAKLYPGFETRILRRQSRLAKKPVHRRVVEEYLFIAG